MPKKKKTAKKKKTNKPKKKHSKVSAKMSSFDELIYEIYKLVKSSFEDFNYELHCIGTSLEELLDIVKVKLRDNPASVFQTQEDEELGLS